MGVNAGVAKLVDAPDLGSGAFGVGVQVPPPAPFNQIKVMICGGRVPFFLFCAKKDPRNELRG
jgi:hypothetical protein